VKKKTKAGPQGGDPPASAKGDATPLLFEALYNLMGPERARIFLLKLQAVADAESATQDSFRNSHAQGGNRENE
jgi:hypothetical protein